MFLKTGLLVVGSVAIIGLLYRAFEWFNLRIGPDAGSVSRISRFADFLKRLPGTLLSWRFWVRLVFDVLLQARLLKKSPLRWIAHIFIAYGFIALLLFHALEDLITAELIPGYACTTNPWITLRNILGLLVIVGVALSLWTRSSKKDLPVKSKGMDKWALILMASIMFSGFLLEGSKIISSGVFEEMCIEYAGIEDPEEMLPLKAYWAQHYGVYFEDLEGEGPFDEEIMEEGMYMNEDNCLPCHAQPHYAFASYGISRIMTPLAAWLNQARADMWFWYLHVGICFLGLALLPFSKFLHMVTSPLTLLMERSPETKRRTPQYLANTRALTLDACTHCGLCSEHCSVAGIYRTIKNENVLPSEKLLGFRDLLKGRRINNGRLDAIREGVFSCTGCYKCTEICPVGLNLQDLWMASQNELTNRNLFTPEVWAKENGFKLFEDFRSKRNGTPLTINDDFSQKFRSLSRGDTFTYCYTCKTCSSSCPVVRHYADEASAKLDLLPHEIIRSIAFGQPDLALNARMLWDCMNCYMCQENCPQGVKICDIIYELKNMAYSRLAEKSNVAGKD